MLEEIKLEWYEVCCTTRVAIDCCPRLQPEVIGVKLITS